MADFFFMTAYEQPLSPSEVKIPENCQGNLNKPLRGLTYDGNRAKLLLYWTLFPTWMHFYDAHYHSFISCTKNWREETKLTP